MSRKFNLIDDALTVIHNLNTDEEEPSDAEVILIFKDYTIDELDQILESLTRLKTLAFLERSKRK